MIVGALVGVLVSSLVSCGGTSNADGLQPMISTTFTSLYAAAVDRTRTQRVLPLKGAIAS